MIEVTAINSVTDLSIENGIAIVTVDSPPVNALGHAVRVGMSHALGQACADPSVAAVVLCCGGRTFFAGADIAEFGKPMASPVLREIGAQLETAAKPVIAAIHGTALGGGLETALACHWRIAERSAKLGLPEVKLGLLAGAGGTQRLPRLVGAAKALEMVVFGEPVGADEALAAGLIDEIAAEDLREEAVALARRIVAEQPPLRRVRDMPPPAAGAELFRRFRTAHAAELQGFEAPEASIRCVEAAASGTFDEGMKVERALFEQLMAGAQCAAQRYLFFAEREAAKVPGLAKDLAAPPIRAVALRGEGAAELLPTLRRAGVEAVSQVHAHPAPDLSLELAPGARARLTISDRNGRAAATALVRFAPAKAPRLLEILRAPHLRDEALATTLTLAKRLGLAAVVTLAGDAFIGEAMAARLAREIDRCAAEGASLAELARAASDFGLRLDAPAAPAAGGSEMLERCVLPLINEGAWLVHRGVAARASDIDMVCVKAGLWAAYRGGPMFHADQLGLERLVDRLRDYEERWGEDYRPCPLLERLAVTGGLLHKARSGGSPDG